MTNPGILTIILLFVFSYHSNTSNYRIIFIILCYIIVDKNHYLQQFQIIFTEIQIEFFLKHN